MSSRDAITAAVGRPSATSRAKVGPDSTATRASGNRSAISSLMRRWRSGSSPFVADTSGTSAGMDGRALSDAPTNSDGTATITTVAPASASA